MTILESILICVALIEFLVIVRMLRDLGRIAQLSTDEEWNDLRQHMARQRAAKAIADYADALKRQ